MRTDLGGMVMQEEVPAAEAQRETMRMIQEGLVCATQMGHTILMDELMVQFALLQGASPPAGASTGQSTQPQGSEGRSVLTLAETVRKEVARVKALGRGLPGPPMPLHAGLQAPHDPMP